MSSESIEELITIEDIERAEDRYKQKYGRYPFRLSTWNPSEYFRTKYLLNQMPLPMITNVIDYLYSYEIDKITIEQLSEKLLGENNNYSLIVTNSGTASIALASSVLCQAKKCRVLVVSPAYFAVFYNFKQMGADVFEIHMEQTEDGYRIPREQILNQLPNIDIIWLTNPIYNTGVYIDSDDIDFLKQNVLPYTYVVVDECFCKNGHEVGRSIQNEPNFIGIHDPMKEYIINGAKFSVIAFHHDLEERFCQWSDIICGSLSVSTMQALNFYISPKSSQLSAILNAAERKIMDEAFQITAQYEGIKLDGRIFGHMMMCYYPNLSSDFLSEYKDFYSLQVNTGVSIIPGTRFHFQSKNGFSFRINLARYDPIRFGRALHRILSYLSEHLS